jgi:hypothetical protein
MRFQAMFSRHFSYSPINQFGEAGSRAMREALRRYGVYRAGVTRLNVEKAGVALTAASAIEHWDMADFHLLSELVPGSIVGSRRTVTVTLQQCAEWERWREYTNGVDIARFYYSCTLPAIADALGLKVEFNAILLDLANAWTVTWTAPGVPEEPNRVINSQIFNDHDASLKLTRQTAMNNGAIYYFCADEETKRFDMVGESALRGHCQQLGLERARRQKAAHLAAGWELNVKTLMENWDGQLVSLWQFAPGILSKGLWRQDCTVCPYANVWSQFGRRALDLGYLYDKEMHTTYYKEYHPDMVLQFAAIKTRGDSVCSFRVSMPSMMLPEEPQFEGYTGRDT